MKLNKTDSHNQFSLSANTGKCKAFLVWEQELKIPFPHFLKFRATVKKCDLCK